MIPPGITRNASHFGPGATRTTPLVFLSKIGPPQLDFHPLQAGVSKTTTGTQVRYLTSTPMQSKKLLKLQNLVDEMFSRFEAAMHRLSHLIHPY